MGSRVGRALSFAFALSVSGGCGLALDASPPDPDAGAVGVDAGRYGQDAAKHDAGPIACVPADCDDGNPCTDDLCAAGTCTHTPNAAPCDDGVYCNGDDTCADGTCSVHGVDPCAAAGLRCVEADATCTGCRTNSDCPPATSMWTDCTFASECDVTGTMSRTSTVSSCVGGTCVANGAMTTETTGCGRISTDGVPCGTSDTGPWTACMADPADPSPCPTMGTWTRTISQPTCSGGHCIGTPITVDTETAPCTYDSTGASCADPVCGTPMCVATACGILTTAGESVADCTFHTCSGGVCVPGPGEMATGSCTISPTDPNTGRCWDGDTTTFGDTCVLSSGTMTYACVGCPLDTPCPTGCTTGYACDPSTGSCVCAPPPTA